MANERLTSIYPLDLYKWNVRIPVAHAKPCPLGQIALKTLAQWSLVTQWLNFWRGLGQIKQGPSTRLEYNSDGFEITKGAERTQSQRDEGQQYTELNQALRLEGCHCTCQYLNSTCLQ